MPVVMGRFTIERIVGDIALEIVFSAVVGAMDILNDNVVTIN